MCSIGRHGIQIHDFGSPALCSLLLISLRAQRLPGVRTGGRAGYLSKIRTWYSVTPTQSFLASTPMLMPRGQRRQSGPCGSSTTNSGEGLTANPKGTAGRIVVHWHSVSLCCGHPANAARQPTRIGLCGCRRETRRHRTSDDAESFAI